jgi:hypothetical protein
MKIIWTGGAHSGSWSSGYHRSWCRWRDIDRLSSRAFANHLSLSSVFGSFNLVSVWVREKYSFGRL